MPRAFLDSSVWDKETKSFKSYVCSSFHCALHAITVVSNNAGLIKSEKFLNSELQFNLNSQLKFDSWGPLRGPRPRAVLRVRFQVSC